MGVEDGRGDVFSGDPLAHRLFAVEVIGRPFGDLPRAHQDALGLRDAPGSQQLGFKLLQALRLSLHVVVDLRCDDQSGQQSERAHRRRQDRELRASLDADRMARSFWASWEGAVLRARLSRSPDPLDHTVEDLLQLIQR